MDLHPDFRDLLAEFARENVSYAVIDLLVSPSGDNLEKVARALDRFGSGIS